MLLDLISAAAASRIDYRGKMRSCSENADREMCEEPRYLQCEIGHRIPRLSSVVSPKKSCSAESMVDVFGQPCGLGGGPFIQVRYVSSQNANLQIKQLRVARNLNSPTAAEQ